MQKKSSFTPFTAGDRITVATMEEQTLDKTALTTISLLEARLLRIEQILYGSTTTPAQSSHGPADAALSSLADLERRFSTLISRFRVYADILKLCRFVSW